MSGQRKKSPPTNSSVNSTAKRSRKLAEDNGNPPPRSATVEYRAEDAHAAKKDKAHQPKRKKHTIREAQAHAEKPRLPPARFGRSRAATEDRYSRLARSLKAANEESESVWRPDWPVETLISCEDLVDELLSTDEAAFMARAPGYRRPPLRPLRLARWFNVLPLLIRQYSPDFVFSPAASAFFETIESRLLHSESSFTHADDMSRLFGKPQGEVVNELFAELRACVRAKPFGRQRSLWRSNLRKDVKSLVLHLEQCVSATRAPGVLAFDLRYVDTHWDSMAASLRADLKCFHNTLRSLSLHRELAGYAWFHQYGEVKGQHIHLLLIIEGGTTGVPLWRETIDTHWRKSTGERGICSTYGYSAIDPLSYPERIAADDQEALAKLCSSAMQRLELAAYRRLRAIPNPQWNKGRGGLSASSGGIDMTNTLLRRILDVHDGRVPLRKAADWSPD